jgi:hypothetical protein
MKTFSVHLALDRIRQDVKGCNEQFFSPIASLHVLHQIFELIVRNIPSKLGEICRKEEIKQK